MGRAPARSKREVPAPAKIQCATQGSASSESTHASTALSSLAAVDMLEVIRFLRAGEAAWLEGGQHEE
jgi:hypothetical protein